jgi:transcriptional regulator with XRE-family HTH domain
MTPFRIQLGRTVRALRANAGFSQEGLAAAARVHRTLIGSLERGRGNPSLETLERLARGLRMAVWQLLLMAETKEGPEGDRRR